MGGETGTREIGRGYGCGTRWILLNIQSLLQRESLNSALRCTLSRALQLTGRMQGRDVGGYVEGTQVSVEGRKDAPNPP